MDNFGDPRSNLMDTDTAYTFDMSANQEEPDTLMLESDDCCNPCKSCNARKLVHRLNDRKCQMEGCTRAAYGYCGEGVTQDCCMFEPCGKFVCDQHIKLTN